MDRYELKSIAMAVGRELSPKMMDFILADHAMCEEIRDNPEYLLRCACRGPQNGEPFCPCVMQARRRRDGWMESGV